MTERNFRTTDLISILLLYVQVVESFKITVTRDTLSDGKNNEGRRLILEESGKEVDRLRKALLAMDDGVQPVGIMNHRKKALESLKKVLRSVEDEEQEERLIRDIESALKSIERETAYHESRKRTKIEKVLASVEEHTNQALTQNATTSKETTDGKAPGVVVSLPYHGVKSSEGRIINLKTNVGNKRVFIPIGWMFCTISPPKCYSTQKKKILASVEEHTNQALTQNATTSKETTDGKAHGVVVSLPYHGVKSSEGRIINLKTNVGNKRVFIPKGWMFCTISPPKCYSTQKKKRHIKKRRHASLEFSSKHDTV